MIRAAIYIRVSTEEQHLHGLSLDAQRDALTEYAKAHDMEIVDIYADEGITARKRLDRRVEFQRLMDDVRADKIDLILVTKLDRWFRNIHDYYMTQDVLERHKCNWRTIFEEYDTTTASGRLHINIMLSINQDECDRTSERIKAVFAHKIERREWLGGRLPVGYLLKDKHLVPDPARADFVRDCFETYERVGASTKAHRIIGNKYGPISLKNYVRILGNEIYIGRYHGIDDYCEPIIGRDLFDRVQVIKSKNRRVTKNDNRYTYIFTGLLRCKYCGRSYVGSTTNKPRGGSTYKYKMYRDNGYWQMDACKNSYCLPETILERHLLAHIRPELEKYVVRYEVEQKAAKKVDHTRAIARIRGKLKKLKDLYLDDLIDKDDYRRSFDDLQQQIADLEADVPVETCGNIEAVKALLALDFEAIYKTLTDEEKRRLWVSVIDKILVGDNKKDIEVVFR